ncbi:MAG TPA: NAD-dependent epimerase/dehydratase family protein [Opitutus sp.]|nr:NAD-dependent epimerase/dehydratase family protein [Opitutus sp.]
MGAVADGNFSGKRLVVLGCGDLGGAVAREGLRRGMRVTALTRNESAADELRADGIGVVVTDLADAAWHAEIPGGADLVLNAVSSGGGGVEGYRRSYVEGMRSVLQWMRERGRAGTFVYTSSTSVYSQGGAVRVSEESERETAGEPEHASGRYEKRTVLREAERLVRENAGACARWFVLRLAGLYGPGRTHLIEQVCAGEIAGRGKHHLNLIHRDDAAAAIWAAFGAPENVADEVFNVADDRPAPKSEVALWLAQRLGVPAPVFTGEPAAGRTAVTPDRVIANDRIKRVLGWAPRHPSYREGYENVLAGGAK